MTFTPELILLAGAQLAILAAAWGRGEALNKGNRERQNERHRENIGRFESSAAKIDLLDAKVDGINGTVGRHGEALSFHGREIERLRDGNGGHR